MVKPKLLPQAVAFAFPVHARSEREQNGTECQSVRESAPAPFSFSLSPNYYICVSNDNTVLDTIYAGNPSWTGPMPVILLRWDECHHWPIDWH